MVSLPTDEQALQFCIMLQAGLPAEQAILYFIDTDDAGIIALTLSKWQRSRAVQKAQLKLLGKSWQDMTLEEKIDAGLAQQYSSLAYLCFSTNYVTANQAEKGKLDTARQALEAKKAGTAGKMDVLSQFFDDIKTGKRKLNSPAVIANLPN